MSPLMILLIILILFIGYSDETNVHATRQRGRSFSETNNRNTSRLERINYVTLNVTRNDRDPSTSRRTRLRQDLQHLLSTMVKKIIYKRRSKHTKWLDSQRDGERIYPGKAAIENKIAAADFPEGNRLDGTEKDGGDVNNYNKIREQTSRDLSQIVDSLMPLVRRSVHSRMPKVRRYRDETSKLKINSGNANGGIGKGSRVKRASEKDDVWMKRDFEDHETNMRMHAFVVRDEDIPPCCETAKEVTNQRYFMCSGAVLTLKHAITTASCIHYADIYEHHVDADLAILVGATSPRAYVIKINRYEMHPDYDYDVDSKNHATNNVAILYLACSIVEQDVTVPSLPKGFNDDVAHMCCREGCHLITVVQSFDNRQTVKILQARYLPAPRHDDDAPNYRQLSNVPYETTRRFNKPTFANDTLPPSRRIRSPFKLAAAPIFYSKEPRSLFRLPSSSKVVETTNAKKRKKTTKMSRQSARTKNQQQRQRKKKKPLKLDELTNGRRTVVPQIPILRALEKEGVNVEEQLAAVDWEKIEETMSKKFTDTNREKMNLFAKNVVDETMKRLESAIDDDISSGGSKFSGAATGGNGSSVFEKLMPTDSRNRSIDSFVKVFTKVVTSLMPPNSAALLSVPSDFSVEEKDLKDPPPLHENCPPLGSPIFTDGVLVGLLAYTCDDAETSVEWKYVNIAKNMNWIRERISTEHGTSEPCGETEKSSQQLRSLPEATRAGDKKNLFKENSTDIRRDRKVEWPSREISADNRRRASDVGVVSIGNSEDARVPVTEASARILKDSWYARNSRIAPRQPTVDDIFANTQNEPRATILDKPVYNVNTCYVKSDGTTDCQSQTDFNIR